MSEILIEKSIRKTTKIIVCEGISDLAFISLYLEKKMSYKFNKNETSNRGLDGGKTHIYFYDNPESKLIICSTSGCDRIGFVFEKYLSFIINRLSNEDKPKIVIIVDADYGNALKNNYLDYGQLHFESDRWSSSKYINDFGESIDYYSFLRVVPLNEDGAFEDLILNVLKDEEKDIYESVMSYYDDMPEQVKKYIKRHRVEMKSRLNNALNLINPESTFAVLSDKFNSINIDNELIAKNYSFLCEI